jgi:hypothetical protein
LIPAPYTLNAWDHDISSNKSNTRIGLIVFNIEAKTLLYSDAHGAKMAKNVASGRAKHGYTPDSTKAGIIVSNLRAA